MEYQYEAAGPALRIIALVFLLVFVMLIVAVLVGLAALPGSIARKRNHPQSDAVNICGWLGLPTGILWVVAIVWAYWKHDARRIAAEAPDPMHDEHAVLVEKLDALEASLATLHSMKGGTNQ
ncbi:heme/copper-type cytochrome/quinol oxidase subunit 2 [Rhodopirellula rubra]|uniref:Heme/copper-type cytochrome/quinol oxidase subunit 2 n=1 Tax=Aporhodopirellula rubra TaxID=980271 RepID=A0A7W5E055_9BACT|nr:DUF3302 domain-containing protein [Aporhodopirellula rubra]MBB3207675.1 heme/copper-type cytochrome/quinol oxidase subunit 2 [Aporhodopirellula rubra]